LLIVFPPGCGKTPVRTIFPSFRRDRRCPRATSLADPPTAAKSPFRNMTKHLFRTWIDMLIALTTLAAAAAGPPGAAATVR